MSTEGRFSADAAPFLRLFRESLYGEVPIVVPAVLETIYSVSTNSSKQYSKTNLVESIKLGSGAERLSILPKQHLRRRRRVHNDDGDIAKLDLIDSPVFFGPHAILLSGVRADMPQVTDQGPARWALHALDAGRRAHKFIEDDVEDWGDDGGCGECMAGVLHCASLYN